MEGLGNVEGWLRCLCLSFAAQHSNRLGIGGDLQAWGRGSTRFCRSRQAGTGFLCIYSLNHVREPNSEVAAPRLAQAPPPAGGASAILCHHRGGGLLPFSVTGGV